MPTVPDPRLSSVAVDSIFVNGTVGSGKSTVAAAIGRLEESAGNAHAIIDLDDIRRAWPSPPGDDFHHELELANLRALAHNYRAAGVERFVLAGVIEVAGEVRRYQDALEPSGLFVCRLTVDHAVRAERLRRRHGDDIDGRDWSLERMPEMASVLADADLDAMVLDTTNAPPPELAERIRHAAGWVTA